uniref:Peroxiredoxin-5 n=2 Tax=Cacopsylla melanoneura TaxID=428564 RepID=A0A8D8LFH5_9HEMI
MQSVTFRLATALKISSVPFRTPVKFNTFHLSAVNMAVKVGDSLPSAELHEDTPQTKINIAEEVKGKKVIIFGVPGAFTPGCSATHLPGYLEKAAELKKKGISEIFCVAVNDAFVMKAWGDHNKAEGKVRFLADPNLEFAKKLGVEHEIPVLGGWRSKRYSMVVDDGKITQLNIEPDGTGLSCSLAEGLKI